MDATVRRELRVLWCMPNAAMRQEMDSDAEYFEDRLELRDVKSDTILSYEFRNECKIDGARYAIWNVEDGRGTFFRSDGKDLPVYQGSIGQCEHTEFSNGYDSLRALVESLAPDSPVLTMSEELIGSLNDDDSNWLLVDPACRLDAIILATADDDLDPTTRSACRRLVPRMPDTTRAADLYWL